MSHLDQLYETWINAEAREQAACLLHGAYGTVESLALYEEAVEDVERAKDAYEAALALCGEGAREIADPSEDPRLFAGLLR